MVDKCAVDGKGMIDDRELSRYGILLNINTQMPSSVPSTVALIVAVFLLPGVGSAPQGSLA